MKQENTSLLRKFFGAKPRTSNPQPERPVTTTAYSQPHVLQQKMREEKLTHGETVLASLSPVRLDKEPEGVVLYFCPMRTINVQQTVTCGDGGSIPAQVLVENLKVPDNMQPGYYTLKNVVLSSNGTIQVKATADTVWEKA
jgi:hypothetical protein